MNFLVIAQTDTSPIDFIKNAIDAVDQELINKFVKQIAHLYQYEIFKNILDLVATKVARHELRFKVQDARFFDLDAGNCQTVTYDGGSLSAVVQYFRKRRKYLITIKKISSDVMIHEIAHMAEKELGCALNLPEFVEAILLCVRSMLTNNPILRQAICSILVEQVRAYPKNQHTSEVFARYFQLFAMTHEVAYNPSSATGYNLSELYAVFEHANLILDKQLSNKWQTLIDQNVSSSSKKYIKNISEIKHVWSDRRIQALHAQGESATDGTDSIQVITQKAKWSKMTKSIKSNPFT
ncbi:conserved hypothetical protein [Alphaproteobacteria bacterium]